MYATVRMEVKTLHLPACKVYTSSWLLYLVVNLIIRHSVWLPVCCFSFVFSSILG